MDCPNKELESYKKNVELFGEDGAFAIWKLSDGENPEAIKALKLLYPDKIVSIDDLGMWDTGSFSGKDQKKYEPEIDKLILSNPNAKVGGGESFNQVKQRTIRAAMKILNEAPYGSLVVTHSSVLKFIMLWDEMGRPNDWSGITAKKYLDMSTEPGEIVRIDGSGGKIFWIRHGLTDENKQHLLRSKEALLIDEGKKEADDIGKKLSEENIPVSYTSPLDRALQTVDRILFKQPTQGDLFDNSIQNKQRNIVKLQADVTDKGKITNVRFPVGETEKRIWEGNTGTAAKNLLSSGKLLLLSRSSTSGIKQHRDLGSKGVEEGQQSIAKLLLPDDVHSSGMQDILGKSFKELFEQADKSLKRSLGIAYILGSRLSESSDSFSGRVATYLAGKGMADSKYIRLENNTDRTLPFIYVQGKSININIARIAGELSWYENADSAMKAMELIMSEEVTHLLVNSLTSDSELTEIYNELKQSNQLEEFKKTYPTDDPYIIAHEYIRTIIQEDIFGTSTARETKSIGKEQIEKALNFLVDFFKKTPTETAKLVINRVRRYIDKINNSSNINYQKDKQIPPNQVNIQLKIINSLTNPKVEQLFNKFLKSNPDKFYSELQQLGSNKQQTDLLRDWVEQNKPKSLNDIITGFAADMSHVVEINTSKSKNTDPDNFLEYGDDENAEDNPYGSPIERNSTHYSNLTVPGGTNYTENEIATPGITPSIQGHAQFSTNNGIGWFRSDEQSGERKVGNAGYNEVLGYGETYSIPLGSKTRRILEIQSDLFQKSRDKSLLVPDKILSKQGNYDLSSQYHVEEIDDRFFIRDAEGETYEEFSSREEANNALTTNYQSSDTFSDLYKDIEINQKGNNFLQLLNKDGNWIPFFIKSIVQDSAKKGYESVLFPTGNTASKVEGHETLEGFKKRKEGRIEVLKKKKIKNESDFKLDQYGEPIGDLEVDQIDNEIEQLQEELKRVEIEGFGALKPIYNFYETRVKNTLDKIYGKDKVERITDEHGNGWFKLSIDNNRDLSTIYFQKSNNTKNIRYDLQSIINQAISGRRTEDIIGTAYSIFKEGIGTGEESKGEGQIIKYYWRQIQNRGLEYKGQLGTEIGSGAEHKTYLDDTNNRVIKIKYDLEPEDIESYLKSLLVYNYLFPDTKYKLLGFTTYGKNISPVVEQPFIDGDDIYDYKAIENVLSKYGFVESGRFEFKNDKLGITIDDLAPRNVFFKNGVPYFIDPQITMHGRLYHPLEPSPNHIKNPPDKKLNQKVQGFLSSIGVQVQRLKNEGQNFAGMADTINGIIKVVDGKAGIDTLPHEATHMFLDLLPDHSRLLADILSDVKKRDEYDQIYEQYKDDPAYQKNGQPDEDKIAKEAAAHIIDDIIVDNYKDKKALKWWERLWKWVKELFTGKSLDNYQQVAEDILNGNTGKLSKSKMEAMKEANSRGEIYYQMDDTDRKRVEKMRDAPSTSDIQKAIIDTIYLKPDKLSDDIAKIANESGIKPHERVILDEPTHTYTDIHGEVYDSTTKKISGEFDEVKKSLYEINAKVGTDIDALLQAAILGKSHKDLDTIDTPTLSEDMKTDLFSKMREFLANNTTEGELPLTQVIVADPESKTAGSIDLLLIHPKGYCRIVDLKTSTNKVYDNDGKLSKTYTSAWKQNEGSIFNQLTFDKDNNIVPAGPNDKPIKLSKELQHSIQTGAYAKMLELQGIPVTAIDSFHINVDIAKTPEGDYIVKKWSDEGVVPHSITDNQPYIDQIVPTILDEEHPSKLQQERPGYDYEKELDYDDPEDVEKIRKSTQNIYNDALDNSTTAIDIATKITEVIAQRETYIKSLNKKSQEAIIQQKTINDLVVMKHEFMRHLSNKKYSNILNEWMDYTIKQSMATSQYISDPTNLNNKEFPSICIQSGKFIEGYSYINHLVDQLHSTQINKFNEAVGAVNELRKIRIDAIANWVQFAIINQDHKFLEEEVKNWVHGNPEDIGLLSRLFLPGSGTSSIPVTAIFKYLSDAKFRTNERIRKVHDEMDEYKEDLLKALNVKDKKEYGFMTHSETGRLVNRENPEQLKREDVAFRNLLDDNGQWIDFRMGTTEEDIEFNKQLDDRREIYYKLVQPETYDGNPGEFYEYKPAPIYDEDGNIVGHDDFEEQRKIFEYKDVFGKSHINFDPDRGSRLRWNIKDGKYYEESTGRLLTEDEIKSISAYRYRMKYYDSSVKKFKKEYVNKVFTGKVTLSDGEIQYRVKDKYKAMRDKSLSGNENLHDPKYDVILNDQTSQGRAQYQFYKNYINAINKLWLLAPAEVRDSMKGRIPVKAAKVAKLLTKGNLPQSRMSIIGKNIKSAFTSTYVTERLTDEGGNIKHSIPIAYTGLLKDQDKIDKIKDRIAVLDAEWNKLTDSDRNNKVKKADYIKQRRLLNDELKTEESRIKPYEIDQDIVKSYKDTAQSIIAYDENSAVEPNIIMIRDMVALKQELAEYAQIDAAGRPLVQKRMGNIRTALKKLVGTGENEKKMIDDIMDMTMYHAAEYPKSFLYKLEKFGVSLSAIEAFLIKPTTSFGIHLLAGSIHLKEGFVGEFFNAKEFARVEWIINTNVIPGWTSNEAVKTAGGKGTKYGSHYEAIMNEVQGFTKGMSDDAKGLSKLLKLEHLVEWLGTTKGSAAILMHMPIKGKDGTISNCYDFFQKNSDKTVTIPDNYKEAWDKIKYRLNRKVTDYQNRFHGAFGELEKMTIQKYPFGTSLAFLKKWVPATIMQMFAPTWIHGNLGISEGMVFTYYKAVRDIITYSGTMREKFEHGYKGLIPKGAENNIDWHKRPDETKEQYIKRQIEMDDKSYEDDPNFKDKEGNTDWKKVERDRDTRKMELYNIKRGLVMAVYIAVAYGAYFLFKSLGKDEDDVNTRRWAYFLARTFDRLRQQQVFALPVLGLEQQYNLLKSPIASLRTLDEFAEAFAATAQLVVDPFGPNYYTTGIHKGELKAKVKAEAVIPGINEYKTIQELNNPNRWSGN